MVKDTNKNFDILNALFNILRFLSFGFFRATARDAPTQQQLQGLSASGGRCHYRLDE